MERIDFFETYTPVVQQKKVQFMLILELLMGLKYKQGYFIAAFTMQTSLRMRRSMLKYQEDLNSSPRMDVRNV